MSIQKCLIKESLTALCHHHDVLPPKTKFVEMDGSSSVKNGNTNIKHGGQSWGGGVAQFVKYLLCRHQELSSNPESLKSWTWECILVTPVLVGMMGRSQGLASQQVYLKV